KIEKIKDKNDFYDYQSNVIKTWLLIFRKELNISVSKKKINSFYECDKTYKDLSASVQKVLEYKIIKEINYWVEELNLSNLCIAGGVGLNCRMNGKIIKLDSVKNLYIQPAAGDAGVALGSAMELANRKGYFSKIKSLFDPYLGCEYEDYEIEKFLYLNNIEFKKVKSAEKYIAESIAKNKVIALFQGRNEWGPRALGKRSIISSPIKGNADYINLNIKHRELG
ncbi:carbamoyltransferase N-terminal domain-containing protein, partial [Clostridioides difficile]